MVGRFATMGNVTNSVLFSLSLSLSFRRILAAAKRSIIFPIKPDIAAFKVLFQKVGNKIPNGFGE